MRSRFEERCGTKTIYVFQMSRNDELFNYEENDNSRRLGVIRI